MPKVYNFIFFISLCNTIQTKQPVSSILLNLAQGINLSKEEKQHAYARDCKKFQYLNSTIPSHNPKKELRVMTYNVHTWRGKYQENIVKPVLRIIKHLNPDVVCLQEVIWNERTKQEITTLFRKSGYYYGGDATFIAGKGSLGNIIFSKYKLSNLVRKRYKTPIQQEYRSFTAGTIIFNKEPVRIYCTHLDVWDKTESARLEELKELTNHIQHHDGKVKNVVVMGDFNAIRKQDYHYFLNRKNVWDLVVKEDKKRNITAQTKALDFLHSIGYRDTFMLRQYRPAFTVWSGKIVDFIFVKPKGNLKCIDTFVYYSSVSDHLPVLADFKIA